jgi:hypothetical protein
VEPADVLCCPRCFGEADVRRAWDSFGDVPFEAR